MPTFFYILFIFIVRAKVVSNIFFAYLFHTAISTAHHHNTRKKLKSSAAVTLKLFYGTNVTDKSSLQFIFTWLDFSYVREH